MINEKLLNFNTKIEARDKKERQAELSKKILQISLIYAVERYKKEKEKNSEYKFSEAVKQFTPTRSVIMRSANNLEGFDFLKNQEEIDIFFEEMNQEIDNVYQSGDLDKILALVNKKEQEFKERLGLNNYKKLSEEKRETKIFSFNQIKNINDDCSQYANLLNKGFSKFDTFTEIHFSNFYENDNIVLGSEFIKNDFAKIAENIVDHNPETSAVVGSSWLLDTPLSKKLGFQVLENETEDEDFSTNDFTTWFQFIDKDGNISQKRLDEFIKNKKIPYRSLVGYIPIEDFLQKYLPENRRGKVKLKKINEEKFASWGETKQKFNEIKNNWNELVKKDLDFEVAWQEIKDVKVFLDFMNERDRGKYLDFIKKMFSQKIEWNDFTKHRNEDLIKIEQKTNELIKDNLFEDYELLIN